MSYQLAEVVLIESPKDSAAGKKTALNYEQEVPLHVSLQVPIQVPL